jgi:hypothetical protein
VARPAVARRGVLEGRVLPLAGIPLPAKLVGVWGAAGRHVRGTPAGGHHGRNRRSHRAGLAERSTVPPAAHAAPVITTTSSAQRTGPTG